MNNPSQQELSSSFRKLSSQDELLNNYAQASSADKTVKVNGAMKVHSQNPSMSGKIPSYSGDATMADLGSRSSRPVTSAKGGSSTGNNERSNKSQAQQDSEYFEKYAHQNISLDGRRVGSSCSSGSFDTKNHVKSSLLIYSLGSMRLLLLLEKDRCKDSELIQTLVS